MDYKEEQIGEIEALEAIYSEELDIISDDPHTLDVFVCGSNEETNDDTKVTVSATIRFTMVETYPDASPLMEIMENTDNLTEELSEALIARLEEEATENLGCVMVFTLVSAAQDYLLQLVEDIKNGIEEEKKRKREEELRLEELKYKGTPVTLENFLAWKVRFDEQMIACGRRKITVKEIKKDKLTGKQLFERDSTLNESDIKFLTDTSSVKVDESLFQDLEDLDLDDELLELEDE